MVMATHAHFYPELGNTVDEIIADGFTPVAEIPTRRTPAFATADAIDGFARFFSSDSRPDAIVILGDRFEMMGVATAALLTGIPIIHIAGGNVTEGAFDNAIRNSISQMASLHLPETSLCASRLIGMGIPADKVTCCGSPGVHNALNETLLPLSALEQSLHFTLGDDFFVATLHSATLDSESPLRRMEDFLKALRIHLAEYPGRKIIITYPNSDSDPAPLIALIEKFAADYPNRVLSIPSLGRVRYLSAATLSKGVIGNSSSGIEEIPSTGVPTLDIGIRQKGRERSDAVVHCEADPDSIAEGLRRISSEEIRQKAALRENPYYKEGTPDFQADAIINFLDNSLQ